MSSSSSDSDSDSTHSSRSSLSNPDGTGTFRRKYNRLIVKCRELEERGEGFEGDVQEVMTRNIKSAKTLFDELSTKAVSRYSQSQSQQTPSTSQGGSSSSRLLRPNNLESLASAPGDMYMAFLHTKLMSEFLRSKTDCIGSSNSGFKLEDFLISLKRKYTVEDSHQYSDKVASRGISHKYAESCNTLPLLTAVVGTFERDVISVRKEKKQRAPIVRKKFKDVERTHQEVKTLDKTKGPEKVANHLNRILRDHTRSIARPTTLYEFVLDPSSLNKSIESLFYVAFLVHDGYAGLSRPSEKSDMRDLALELKPEKRVDKPEDSQNKNAINRNQYILSFNPRMFKKLCRISKGEPIIPTYTDLGELADTR